MTVLYFAYGSNMKRERMIKRIPSARAVGSARIIGKRLTCNKRSIDGSGKANLADSVSEEVWGVLYRVGTDEMAVLDRIEDGYSRQEVSVVTEQGETVRATVYVSGQLIDEPIPYESYKAMIVDGARQHQLPEEYIELLEDLPAKPDPHKRDC